MLDAPALPPLRGSLRYYGAEVGTWWVAGDTGPLGFLLVAFGINSFGAKCHSADSLASWP